MNKITINTKALQLLCQKAIKCSPNIPGRPMTSILNIKVVGTDLVLTTTDMNMVLKVVGKDLCSASSDGFFISVGTSLFSNLVAKTTSELITLEIAGKVLSFKGNGVYSLPLMVDVYNNNEMAVIEDIEFDKEKATENFTIATDLLKSILAYNKQTVAKTMNRGKMAYLNYYFDNKGAISYNLNCATVNNFDVAQELKAKLLPSELVELFAVLDGGEANVICDEEKIAIITPTAEIVGVLGKGLEDFKAQALRNLTNTEDCKGICSVDKTELIGTIDRLSLFVDNLDDRKTIKLAFGTDSLRVGNVEENSNELIKYISQDKITEHSLCVDLGDLRSILGACQNVEVKIVYGGDVGLIIIDENVIRLVPIVEDRAEEETKFKN